MPSVFYKPWANLTEDEKEAAQVFGYTKGSWDDDSGREGQSNVTSRPWEELTMKKRNALKALGLNRANWNNRWRGNRIGQGAAKDVESYGVPTVFYKPWVQLTENEKQAAQAFGYAKASWDDDSGREVQPHLTNRLWDELTMKKRNAVKVWGLNKANWNGRWRMSRLGQGAAKDNDDGYDPHDQLEHWCVCFYTCMTDPWYFVTPSLCVCYRLHLRMP